ncbi:FAD-binding oxidoreductase [Cognatishimia sp. MH4019]|uniref:NAD(P)/FAD-dependent oxidoreductase n=1 Tax=Cognatishimia sp. MH4019 TaxID=2854030 RepID=UPI001CD531A8|nr:FAD-binding oxidoreductase [Cognatishimia sp. MH4019]
MNLLYANDRAGVYPQGSWYTASTDLPAPRTPVRGETRAQVCIVGAGYTGLSAALHLAQAGIDVIVLEAHRAGFGASGRNGGQVGLGWNVDQMALEDRLGADTARLLWDMSLEAVGLTRDLAGEDFRPGLLHTDWTRSDLRDSHALAAHMQKVYGKETMVPLDRKALEAYVRSPRYKGGVFMPQGGHLHPLRYALRLAAQAEAAGAVIFEESPVHHIKIGPQPIVQTDKGRVIAQEVLLAGNGYLGGLNRKVASRVMPINNYVVATDPLPDPEAILPSDVAVADSKFVVNYFRRTEDNRLLFGGGESYGYRFPEDIAAKVRRPLEQVFPQLKGIPISHAWGGTLAITMTRLPYFARPEPHLWSASGYSGHGVAMATFAGRVLADAIAGRMNQWDVLAGLPMMRFPGGPAFKSPLLKLAMTWYALRDRLGV